MWTETGQYVQFSYSEMPYAIVGSVLCYIVVLGIDCVTRSYPSLSSTSIIAQTINNQSSKRSKRSSQLDNIIGGILWVLRLFLSSAGTLLLSYALAICAFEFLLWHTGASEKFRAISTTSQAMITSDPEALALEKANQKARVRHSQNICLTGIGSALDGSNGVYPFFADEENKDDIVPGHTIWINEYMAVGHAMYDIYVMQLLYAEPIDRIALQRAPCATDDLCQGIGTWLSWYEGFYGIMIAAFRPNTTIYVRSNADDDVLYPLLIEHGRSLAPPKEMNLTVKFIQLDSIKCFEHVYMRSCYQCFYHSIEPKVANKFKAMAYKIVNKILFPPTDNSQIREHSSSSSHLTAQFRRKGPIVITLSYRGGLASRQIININQLINALKDAFPAPKYVLQFYYSSNNTVPYYEQIALVARSHVVITEHGSFQSNLIYMRNKALLVDLRGNYATGEFRNYQELSKMFDVLHHKVITRSLTEHRLYGYYIEEEECNQIVKVVQKYLKQAPYLQNSN